MVDPDDLRCILILFLEREELEDGVLAGEQGSLADACVAPDGRGEAVLPTYVRLRCVWPSYLEES